MRPSRLILLCTLCLGPTWGAGCSDPAPPPLDTSAPDPMGTPRPVIGKQQRVTEKPNRDPALRGLFEKE